MSARDMFYSKSKKFSNAEEKAFAREDLIFNVTEDLLVIMEDKDVTKAELSRRLGKSKSYVSQILGGARNMTLGSLSDICFSLGFKPKVELPVEAFEASSMSNDSTNYATFSVINGGKHIKPSSVTSTETTVKLLVVC